MSEGRDTAPTGPSADTAGDKVFGAIGILQAHVLASESTFEAQALWGNSYAPMAGVEAAIRLLLDALPMIERT